jgi:hypothetical protein
LDKINLKLLFLNPSIFRLNTNDIYNKLKGL